MMFVRVILIAFLSVGFARGAGARTPTATSTPTPASTSTPPPSPNQISTFIGSCWLNAELCRGQTMTARIGDTVCATDASPVAPPDSVNRLLFTLRVPSAEVVPGCGFEGAEVTFSVAGRMTAQTAIWHSGTQQFTAFTAGYPFARFVGSLAAREATSGQRLVPFVGAMSCGSGYLGVSGYEADILSNEQQPGCGVEGSQVTFKLLDAQGNVIAVANEKAVWHVWDGVSHPQRLDLTFGPATVITMPGTGTGDGPQHAGSAWALLGFVGLASAATGFALRKQALTR